MSKPGEIVFVVDDDSAVRKSLASLLRSAGLTVETFESAQQFLAAPRPEMPSCLVLDVRLPGISGLELQKHLMEISIDIPIVFITGHGDIPTSVRAIKAGAVEFLTKPFRDHQLLDAIHESIARDRRSRLRREKLKELRLRQKALTPRERQVMNLVVSGLLNKQIAMKLGIRETTVKIHRAQVMQKMRAQSLADLVRMCEQLGIAYEAES